MSSEMDNDFNQDYAGEIALECEKLEQVVKLGLEEYTDSYQMLGKSNWYSLGLENDESDRQKDTTNKRNILLRIIDSVVNFIKMIGKKIAEWFRACKAAIMRFFGEEKVDGQQLAARVDLLVDGLKPEQAAEIIGKLSKESKEALAEILDKDYGNTFRTLYADYKKIGEKCDNVAKFVSNEQFFTEFKFNARDLKAILKDNKVYENADDSLKKLLTGQGQADRIKEASTAFNEISTFHEKATSKLEHLLKQIPDAELEVAEGSNIDAKRQEMVKLISDLLKIDGEIVLKVNSHMQAISMLMAHVVKYRAKRLVFIPM